MVTTQKLIDYINLQVVLGFLSKEEIRTEIRAFVKEECLDVSSNWLDEQINLEWEAQNQQQKNWPVPTDVDRLDAVFDDLCRQNIIGLHNPGYTIAEGIAEVEHIERYLNSLNKKTKGFCFYTQQDLEQGIRHFKLELTFNKLGNTKASIAIALGNIIVETFKKHGFSISWDKQATKKIKIFPIRWQHFYKTALKDFLDYDIVMQQLLLNK